MLFKEPIWKGLNEFLQSSGTFFFGKHSAGIDKQDTFFLKKKKKNFIREVLKTNSQL